MSRRAAAEFKTRYGLLPSEAAGLVKLAHARSTGALIAVYNAVEAGLEDWGWATVCETHGRLVIHPTRSLATEWASHPDVWCDACRPDPTRSH